MAIWPRNCPAESAVSRRLREAVVTRRLVRAIDLADDEASIAAYRQWHAPGAVWPEITRYIRATGVISMEIWGVGNRLCMILEVTDDFPRPIPEPQRVRDWERLMSEWQRPLPYAASDGKWSELERVFSLDESRETP
jgi:L-rhamnose mutarotase